MDWCSPSSHLVLCYVYVLCIHSIYVSLMTTWDDVLAGGVLRAGAFL